MEDEKSSELERAQQQITLNLQEIDENFAACNQLVASKIMPELERFAEATEKMWESSKTWLHFFKVAGQTLNYNNTTTTNRPPFSPQERLAARSQWQGLHGNVNIRDRTGKRSISRQYRTGLREPPSTGSISSQLIKDMQNGYGNDTSSIDGQSGSSTPNSVNSKGALVDEYGNQITSPPRTRAFTPLIGRTPLRETVEILNDYSTRWAQEGFSESSDEGPSPLLRKRPRNMPEDILAMDKDDPSKKADFWNFVNGRKQRFRSMKEHEELPRLRRVAASPSNRSTMIPEGLVSTPTTKRVWIDKGKDLRYPRAEGSEQLYRKSPSATNEFNSEDDEAGAYQFSEGLPENLIEDSPM